MDLSSCHLPTCPLCSSANSYRLKAQPRDYEYDVRPRRIFKVHACRSCRSRFLFPRPTVPEIVSFYPPDYHAYHEDHGPIARFLVSLRARRRAEAYLSLVPSRPIRLFDIGTGDCRHFQELSTLGDFRFAGVEIHPDIAAKARKNGFDVFPGTFEELDHRRLLGQFNLVTMYQLVEHVLDPRLLFRKTFDLLQPGGYVLGQLPCVQGLEPLVFQRFWAGYHYPRHLQMVSKIGLQKALHQAGFTEIKVSTALHLQSGLSLQNLLVGACNYRPRMQFGKTPLYSFLLLAVAPFCVAEYLLGFGGMMNFSAQKPSS